VGVGAAAVPDAAGAGAGVAGAWAGVAVWAKLGAAV